MIERLPQIASRSLAVAILLAVAVAVYALAVQPVIVRLQEASEQLEINRSLLGRYLDVADRQPASTTPTEGAEVSMFWSGNTEAIILASIQSKLQAIASSRGAQVRAIRPLIKRGAGRLQLGGLSIDMTGKMAAVQQTVQDIEMHSPIFIIEAAHLRPSQSSKRGAGDLFVDAQIDVYGALLILASR